MAAKEFPGISVSDLKLRLRDDPIGAFAFWGTEELLKQFYLQKFITLIEKEGSADFNLVRLDFNRDRTVSDLIDEMQILPFGGEKRLVICRGLSPLKLSDSDLKRLLAALEESYPYLILILYLEGEEFGGEKSHLTNRKALALAEKITFCSFPLQSERVLLTWSKKILEKDGLTAQDKVLRELFRLCGNRMQVIRGELEKIIAYLLSQKRDQVLEEDVALFSQDTTEFAVYHLSDALLAGATPAVEKILNNLKRQEVEPVNVAAYIARTLTNALLITEGARQQDCKKATNLLPWQFDRYHQSLYGVKRENLKKAMMMCLELDRRLKGNRSDSYVVLEISLIEMSRLLGDRK